MMRKEYFIFKANKKREILSLILMIVYGIFIGLEVSVSIFDSTGTDQSVTLGYVILILLAPVASYQQMIALVTEMTTERQNKMSETLKILGLDQYIYAISHLSIRSIYSTFLALILSVFIYLYNNEYMEISQFASLACALILLCLGNLTLVLII